MVCVGSQGKRGGEKWWGTAGELTGIDSRGDRISHSLGTWWRGPPETRRVENSQLGPESLHLWGVGGASRCMAVGVHMGACARGRGATPGVQWGSTPDRPVVC